MSPSPLLCRCKSSSRQCFSAFKILSSATIIRQDELCHPPVHGLHFRIVVNSADWVLRWCDKYFRFTLKISLFADLRGNQLMALLLRRQAKLHGVSGWLDTCYGAHVCSCPTTRINLGTIIQISTQLWPFTVDFHLRHRLSWRNLWRKETSWCANLRRTQEDHWQFIGCFFF